MFRDKGDQEYNCLVTQFSGKVGRSKQIVWSPVLQSNLSQCDIKRFQLGENFNKNFGGLYAAVALKLKKQEHENC